MALDIPIPVIIIMACFLSVFCCVASFICSRVIKEACGIELCGPCIRFRAKMIAKQDGTEHEEEMAEEAAKIEKEREEFQAEKKMIEEREKFEREKAEFAARKQEMANNNASSGMLIPG